MLVFLKQMDPKHAEKTLKHIFPLIRGVIRDKASSRIRNTALWVISWMVEKYPPLLVVPATLQDLQLLLDDLIACLNDGEGRVSPSSCIALTSVVKASHTLARQQVSALFHTVLCLIHFHLDVGGWRYTATYLCAVTLL